ncbi:hypothetical protein RFI_40316 [Reticulomyxa filosa]|uniref:Uncharacterized protein n=1 Tax=Reticulomyxa filosa TaxID=46433 RepID=X6L7C1_RETFI|nr:hypothetical protein RFI_40316 [Reticulomyxa filosa]|eukprot:ETN97215.1 hypothetical protein RFI_40316 [Reticulomyxa filosa]
MKKIFKFMIVFVGSIVKEKNGKVWENEGKWRKKKGNGEKRGEIKKIKKMNNKNKKEMEKNIKKKMTMRKKNKKKEQKEQK